MSIKHSPLMTGIVTAFGLAGSLMADEPPMPRAENSPPAGLIRPKTPDGENAIEASTKTDVSSVHEIEDGAVLDDLNPIFIRIVAAAIQNNEESLKQSLSELDAQSTKSAAHKTAAGLAKLAVYEELNDPAAYAKQCATIAAWERTELRDSRNITRRMNACLSALKNEHPDWYPLAVQSALSDLWPAADGLTIDLVLANSELVETYEQKAALFDGIQKKARDIAETDKYSGELLESWNQGRQFLARISIDLHVRHVHLREMFAGLRQYFDEFGPQSKYGALLFAQALETLNLARKANLDFDPRSVPEREWLENWYAKFKVTGDENLHERLVAAWTAYAEMPSPSLPLGMVDIIELRRDYRLREKVDCESPNPILADLLKQLSSDGKLLLSVAEKTDPRLTVASYVSFHGPLYEAMQTIAETPGIQGQWERIENGYQIHSAIKSPPSRDVTPGLLGGPRMWLVLINIVFVLAVCRFFWHRGGKRSSSSGVPD